MREPEDESGHGDGVFATLPELPGWGRGGPEPVVPPAISAGPAAGAALGFAGLRPDNGAMEIKSDNPEHGFQFPGTFELSAMGAAGRGLESELPRLLEKAGVEVLSERISWKHSSNGKYVSVRIAFKAASRELYDAAHTVLRSHPEVKWTL